MKNLDSVFAAYIIGWAVFFLLSERGKAHLVPAPGSRALEEHLGPGQIIGWEEKGRDRDVPARRAGFAGGRAAISAEFISRSGHYSHGAAWVPAAPSRKAHFVAALRAGAWPLRGDWRALANRSIDGSAERSARRISQQRD